MFIVNWIILKTEAFSMDKEHEGVDQRRIQNHEFGYGTADLRTYYDFNNWGEERYELDIECVIAIVLNK